MSASKVSKNEWFFVASSLRLVLCLWVRQVACHLNGWPWGSHSGWLLPKSQTFSKSKLEKTCHWQIKLLFSSVTKKFSWYCHQDGQRCSVTPLSVALKKRHVIVTLFSTGNHLGTLWLFFYENSLECDFSRIWKVWFLAVTKFAVWL